MTYMPPRKLCEVRSIDLRQALLLALNVFVSIRQEQLAKRCIENEDWSSCI